MQPSFSVSRFKLVVFPESSNSNQKEQYDTSSLSTTPSYHEGKKYSFPLPVHLQSQRNLSSKLTRKDTLTHRLQTFTHNTHMLSMGTREGLTGAWSADAAVSQMGHFAAYM